MGSGVVRRALGFQAIATEAAIGKSLGNKSNILDFILELPQLGIVLVDQILLNGALFPVLFDASRQVDAIDLTLHSGQTILCEIN